MARRELFVLVLVACSSARPRPAPDPKPPEDVAAAGSNVSSGVGSAAVPAPATPATFRSRREFARAMAGIKPGMTADEVRAKLGPPDDIRTERDPGGITATGTAEVWRYGTSGHLTFATLGTVHVKADRKVQYVYGESGTPPEAFDEAELRRLLALVDAVPSYNATFEPLPLVQAVNALEKLQKGRALAVIEEYLRVSSPFEDGGREGVFLLNRALFELPKTGMPPMRVGAPDLEPPTDGKLLPYFPLVFVDDIPLNLVGGYLVGGQPQDPESDVLWFRHNGSIRLKPLRLPARPLEVATRFIDGPLRKLVTMDDVLKTRLYDQLLRLLGTVYRPPSTVNGWFPPGPDLVKRWTKIRAEIDALGPVWDQAASRYTKKDGSVRATQEAIYQRVWWDMPIYGTSWARTTLERINDTQVKVEIRFELHVDATVPQGALHLIDDKGDKLSSVPVGEATTAPGATSTFVSGWVALVPKGKKIRVLYVQGPTIRETSGELVP